MVQGNTFILWLLFGALAIYALSFFKSGGEDACYGGGPKEAGDR